MKKTRLRHFTLLWPWPRLVQFQNLMCSFAGFSDHSIWIVQTLNHSRLMYHTDENLRRTHGWTDARTKTYVSAGGIKITWTVCKRANTKTPPRCHLNIYIPFSNLTALKMYLMVCITGFYVSMCVSASVNEDNGDWLTDWTLLSTNVGIFFWLLIKHKHN